MKKIVSINFRPDDTPSLETVKNLTELILDHGGTPQLPGYAILNKTGMDSYVTGDRQFVSDADMVVAIGGDGTFLRTARLFLETEKPIFGINRGTLGFLTEFNPGECKKFFPLALEGALDTGRRAVFEAVHIHDGEKKDSLYFINDAVLSKGAFSRAITMRLEIDGSFLNCYSGDGLIISTATGSTAYSLSAGGPILSPEVSNVYLFNPVCPHSLGIRPMVIPATSTLKARIVTEMKNLLLTIDGQEAIQIEGNDDVIFRSTPHSVVLIQHPEKSYYDILREKLNWGK